MRKDAACEFILERLRRELPETLTYHNALHTLDVVQNALSFAKTSVLSERETILLETAAYYHDTGYFVCYDRNEPEGARIACETLPAFGYDAKDCAEIAAMILSTDFTRTPKTLPQKILRDADIAYVGTPDFRRISALFRTELGNFGITMSDKKWLANEINFFRHIHFFSEAARTARDAGRLENLKSLEREQDERC